MSPAHPLFKSLSWCLLVLVLGLTVAQHLHQARIGLALEAEGSPPPRLDSYSLTGYAEGRRHFLGTKERGETYRWITATQQLRDEGFRRERFAPLDQTPEPRRSYASGLYTGWLAAQSWLLEAGMGLSPGLAAERVPWLDPLLAQLFALTGWFLFCRRTCSPAFQIAGLLLIWLLPGWGEQFISGVLSPRPWAFLLGTVGLLALATRGWPTSRTTALLNAAALAGAGWLDPAIGLPFLVLTASVPTSGSPLPGERSCIVWWGAAGLALTSLGAWLDGIPFAPRETELRYIHLLNTAIWVALVLWHLAWIEWKSGGSRRKAFITWGGAALALGGWLRFGPLTEAPGWWTTSPAQMRLSSLDETVAHSHLLAWCRTESWAMTLPWLLLWTAGLALCARVKLSPTLRERTSGSTGLSRWWWPCLALLFLAAWRVRWLPVTSLVVLAAMAQSLAGAPGWSRRLVTGGCAALAVFSLGVRLKVDALAFFAPREAEAADVEAMAYRQFSHWLSRRVDPREAVVLAPPEASDSLNFHGGLRTVMSTAWETYAGQVAASRILSAPEDTEVEAVMQSRHITHLALPSWDPIFPLWVRRTDSPLGEPFYDRVQKWIFPSFLRPVPYHLPSTTIFREEKLAVFALTAPQDEALQLSRLAEYFVEMGRLEPAGLVVKVLRETFPRDPNASLARALEARQRGDARSFQQELALVIEEVKKGRVPADWDRRVQRAIVLALGGHHDLARPEIEVVLAEAEEATLRTLSPLESFRLQQLADGYRLASRHAQLTALLQQQAAELTPAR